MIAAYNLWLLLKVTLGFLLLLLAPSPLKRKQKLFIVKPGNIKVSVLLMLNVT